MNGLRIIPAAVLICMACGQDVDRVVAFMTSSIRDGKVVTNTGAQRTVKICRTCVQALAREFDGEKAA